MAKKLSEVAVIRIDPDKAKQYVKQIENLYAEIDTATGEHMAECKNIREQIKEVFSAAAEKLGVPVTALRAEIKIRKLERKAKEARDELEKTEQESLDAIRTALGELKGTPLGDAAVAAAEKKAAAAEKKTPAKGSKEDDKAFADADPAKAQASAEKEVAEKLAGIKPLKAGAPAAPATAPDQPPAPVEKEVVTAH